LRARVNITGLKAGDELLGDVTKAFADLAEVERNFGVRLIQAFRELPDEASILACAKAVQAAAFGDSPTECQGKVTIGLDAADYEGLRNKITLAREKADSRYLGLDLRFDTGDPTLAGDSTKEATSLQAGLAFGRTGLNGKVDGISVGIQGRLGVRYTDPKIQSDSTVWSVEGALGFEMRRLISANQAVRFSTGLEFRYANKPDSIAARVQTDYLLLRGALSIPLLGGTSITVGFTGPLVGEESPNLSVNFNWGLLLSSFAQGAEAGRR
jgi:hypothetical protein